MAGSEFLLRTDFRVGQPIDGRFRSASSRSKRRELIQCCEASAILRPLGTANSSALRSICAGKSRSFFRWFVVTPDMHRHHSITAVETNSNFGFTLPWWDRLTGTYRDQPVAGHDAMMIRIQQFREARELGPDRMLLQPFHGRAAGYQITWRSPAQAGPSCRQS